MKIKEALDKIINFVNNIQEATAEESAGGKKINALEFVPLGVSAIGLIPVFSDIQSVVDDFKSLDEAGKDDLVAYFAEKFDIENDKAESIVESTFKFIVDALGYVGSFSDAKAA